MNFSWQWPDSKEELHAFAAALALAGILALATIGIGFAAALAFAVIFALAVVLASVAAGGAIAGGVGGTIVAIGFNGDTGQESGDGGSDDQIAFGNAHGLGWF
jgi:hypothetical protein